MMRNSLIRSAAALAALAATALLVPLAGATTRGATTATDSRAASTVVIAAPLGPDTLDPIGSSLYNVDSMVWSTVYETLGTTTVTGKVIPVLAKSWTISRDGLTYTFHLRPGVKFQNGDPLTAEDVVYSIERAKSKGIPLVSQRLTNIASVDAPDALTAVIHLKQPDGTFVYTIADPSGVGVSILDHKYDGNPATAPMGTGPLKFVSFTPNSSLVLQRNDAYWNKKVLPNWKSLQVRFIADDASQVAALRSGAVSLIQPTNVATLRAEQRDRASRVVAFSNLTFFLSVSRIGKTENPNIAKAVALAIDRNALAKTVFLGQAAPGTTASPYLDYGLPLGKLPNSTRNVAQAKKLLAAAGYPNGVDLNFIYPTRPPFQNSFFEVLQGSLAQAGIRIQLQPVEQQVWLTKFLNAQYDLSATDQSWYANPIRYVLPRTGWQAPPEKALPSLPPLLAKFAQSSAKQRPAAFQAVQRLEAANAYPFISTVWVKQGVVYRPDKLNSVKPTLLVTSSQRNFLLSIDPK
jgi:ABC-type transport system substrate-binding protein